LPEEVEEEEEEEEELRIITKLPNSEQSYKGKVKTHQCVT
jgi:hypothetical protein